MDSPDIVQTAPPRPVPARTGAKSAPAGKDVGGADETKAAKGGDDKPKAEVGGAAPGDAFLALIESFMNTGTVEAAEVTAEESAEGQVADGQQSLIAPGLLAPAILAQEAPEAATDPAAALALAAAVGTTDAPAADAPATDAAMPGDATKAVAGAAANPGAAQPAAPADEAPVDAELDAAGTPATTRGLPPEPATDTTLQDAAEAEFAGKAMSRQAAAEQPAQRSERGEHRESGRGWGESASDAPRHPQAGTAGDGLGGAPGGQDGGGDAMASAKPPVEPGQAGSAAGAAAAAEQPGFKDTLAALSGRREGEPDPSLSFAQVQAQPALDGSPDRPESAAASRTPRMPLPHPATEMVGVQLQKLANGRGEQSLTIQLRPVELGRVDVRLDFGQEGRVRADIRVERQETLDLLQKDSRSLEKALQAAGLETDAGSLNFSLSEGSSGGAERSFADLQRAVSKLRGGREAPEADAKSLTLLVGANRAADPGRVDIRI
ncbi:flagellar hook-length control protein FliK [Arenibaculum pallidiluteum]|uniref:flagellar hook-length control protein FliK n=1 Tax=Arenibaculum pallidiluteum TaxID=2812559 RepID=UPI001A97CC47|nr:flagellar hook-length control protein FliK [Arenibaculum pallidiluteum]